MIWGQSGGSLRTDSAGVWWGSMPFEQRIQYPSFIENQSDIESDWSKDFGDRKNEIVFIGLGLNQEEIKTALKSCLMTKEELANTDWEKGYQDEWPVERVYAN